MCDTYEPPVFGGPFFEARARDQTLRTSEADTDQEASLEDIDSGDDVAKVVHSGDVLRGDMCSFLRGYFEFLAETKVAVSSILRFMPGMRVAIATLPRDYHVYNR